MLALPHKGIQGEHTLKHIKGDINKVLLEDKSMQLVYKGLSLELIYVKDKTKEEHYHDFHDLTYNVKCPM